ncbi:hypothetical protein P4O66_002162 [Electrophorus voltai]|uniref:receptor protein-tyrosine kinase n=1 Tax=Electrophorus voltai TaxID=2609070 RepID=A0AAD9DSI7_9TELE|nr:hypothetical protein P4O66_002162 [Electrophorus voltai]
MGSTRGMLWGDIVMVLMFLCDARLLIKGVGVGLEFISILQEGSSGLYFPQNIYFENIYVGQPAGMPVLQVHALRERPSERPYFYMCSKNPYAAWFHIDPFSGILYMNKTLEWTDFDTKSSRLYGHTRKLSLKVAAATESQKALCTDHRKVEVALTFVNATAPSCGQLQLEKLCFPDRDINPHIKENCMPGPLRQLRRFTYAFLCPNYTISYRVKSDTPVPFALNDSTSELVVVAPVDREEKEAYPVIIVCMVQVEKTLHTLFTPLHITVYDEDDNPPYVNGTDTVDVLIEFSRSEGTVLGSLYVYDRDTTPIFPEDQTQNKFVGTLMTNDSWIKDMFTIQHTFREEKAIFDNVRGTVHEYKLSLSTNVSVEDKRSFQLAYLVNDTTYPGTEGTVMLHFNVTVLPVTIHFSNITYFFVLSRKATAYSQIGKVCVDNCLKFKGIDIAYWLEMGDRSVPEDVQPCYAAVSVARSQEDMSGLLYVNDTAPFARPECQELQYVLVAQEQQKQFQAKTQLLIILEGKAEVLNVEGHRTLACAEKRQRGECETYRGLGAPTGRCQWRQDTFSTEAICDEMCKTIIATAVLLSFIVSILLSSYFIHRYHKNTPKPPISSAEMTFRRPAQSYPISYSANNVRRSSMDSVENQVAIDTFKIPEDPKWEFPRKNLVLGKTLGEGEFGKVVKATAFRLKGKAGYTTVAVKMLKGPLYLIVEYAKYGSLRNFLRESRKVGPSYLGSDANRNSSYLEDPDERALTMGDLISFAWQISRGMQYLAEMKLVHRDLAARNVLVAEGRKMKISDFGLSRDVYEEDSYVKRSKGRIPVKWMAIESLFDHIYTTQSDVWSFGVLLWEIVTLGGNPYPGIAPERLFNLLKTGYRMERPENCTEEMYSLMLRCWKQEADKRPTFSEISKELERMMVKSRDYLDLAASTPADALLYDDTLSEEDTPLVDCNNAPLPRTLPSTWIENKLYGRISHAFTRF